MRRAAMAVSLPAHEHTRICSQFQMRRQTVVREIQAIERTVLRHRQEILDRFSQSRAANDEAERQAARAHEAAKLSLHTKLQQERVRLDAEYRALKIKLAPIRKEHDTRTGDLSRRTMQQRFELCRLEKELDRYRRISPSRYLFRIIGLRLAA